MSMHCDLISGGNCTDYSYHIEGILLMLIPMIVIGIVLLISVHGEKDE